MKRLAVTAVLSITMALLASGCLWGIVSDAETGQGLKARSVWWIDENGYLEVTETDENGLFIFEGHFNDEVPFPGEVRFLVRFIEPPAEGLGCESIDEVRMVDYIDVEGIGPVSRQDFDITCKEYEPECPCYEGSPCWPWCQTLPTRGPHLPVPPPPAPTPTPRPGLIPSPAPRAINTPIPPPR